MATTDTATANKNYVDNYASSPLAVMHASGALPGSGAYTDEAAVELAPGAKRVSFWITYTADSGASSGQPKFRVEWEDEDAAVALEAVNDGTTVTAASPYGQMIHYLGEFMGPAFAASASGRWPLTFEVPAGAKKVMLHCAEVGDTSNPGTIQVEYSCAGQL